MSHELGCECEGCCKIRKEVMGYLDEIVREGLFEYGTKNGQQTIERRGTENLYSKFQRENN